MIRLFILSFMAAFLSLDSFAFDAKEYYQNRCLSCHDLGARDGIGPGLEGVVDERDERWLIEFIQDSQGMVRSGDPLATELFEEWDRRVMPAFHLSDENTRELIAFIAKGEDAELAELSASSFDSSGLVVIDGQEASITNTLLFLLIGGALFIVISAIIFKINNKILTRGFCSLVVIVGISLGASELVKFARAIDYTTGYAPIQPINFSHKVHAGDNEISCLYCHYGADKGIHGTIPPVNLCLNCHIHVKTDSEEVQKVYDAIEEKRSIEWEKVHHYPDFATFNHSVHVNSEKVSCQDCHGPVEEMDIVKQYESMSMGFCLECHRKHDDTFAEDNIGDDVPGPLFDCASCHY